MKRELGEIPSRDEIKRVLIQNFEKLTGKLEPAVLDTKTLKKLRELERLFMSREFLFKKTPRIPDGVKIKEGIDILYGIYKSRGGLIRTAEEIENKKTIMGITVSGDFNLFPKNGLKEIEQILKNEEFNRDTIKQTIEQTYEKYRIESPGVEPEDITKTIIEAKRS
jgi:hypothetical protein